MPPKIKAVNIISSSSNWGRGSFKAWMFNIARNLTLDHLRAVQRRGPEEAVEEGMEPIVILIRLRVH